MRVPRTALPIAAIALAAPALGADVQVSGVVRPGTLTIGPLPRTVVVKRLASAGDGWRRAVVSVPITVTDARGSGAGWAVTLAASVRTARGRRVAGLTTMLRGVQMRCASCTRPRATVAFPLWLAESKAVRAFTAARGSGMGRMRLTARIAITAPVNAPRGAYVLRPRLSQVAGP